MNYHSDTWIADQIDRHYKQALKLYNEDQIIGVFCQGSQNYGLDVASSDIDTKCIIVPTFKEIAINNKPVSTTHILDNNEHLDAKDVRLYFQCFTKQNLNFLEILFTNYSIVNPLYAEQWARLIKAREDIAHMNPYRAVKSMKGIALEKYYAMEHPYPSKLNIIEKYGYDGKQVHHLIRVDNFLTRYINGEPYEDCLKPTATLVSHMLDYKRHEIPLEEARTEAKEVLAHVTEVADDFCAKIADEENSDMRDLLQDVSYNIMKTATILELQ